ncbi:MAG: NUDIX hydrolase [Bacteroidia bacterium]
MKLNQVLHQIKQALDSGKLPGAQAQYKMSSMGRKSRVASEFGKKEHKKSAVLILLYELNGKVHFALTQRHNYKGVHSGQVSLPGGKLEKVDVDLRQTALRETYEEIGVPQSSIEIIGALTDLYIPPSNHHVHPFVGYVKDTPKFIKDDYEVDELLHTELSLLLNNNTVAQTTIEIAKGLKIKTPFFDLHSRVVWGATAMILNEFKELLSVKNQNTSL